ACHRCNASKSGADNSIDTCDHLILQSHASNEGPKPVEVPFLYHAHSRNSHGHRHDLVGHLRSVADLSGRFASAFDASDLARFLGLWHDLGKFNPKFQEYLLACEANPGARGHGPDHKAAGAQLAAKHLSLA